MKCQNGLHTASERLLLDEIALSRNLSPFDLGVATRRGLFPLGTPISRLASSLCLVARPVYIFSFHAAMAFLVILLGAFPAMAQLLPPGAPGTPQTAQQPPQPVALRMHAVLGVNPPVAPPPPDESLKDVASLLSPLGFSGVEKINIVDRELMEGQEARFPINAIYSLVVARLPQDQQDTAGLDIRIEMLSGDKIINALSARAQARAGDTLVLRGVPLQPGELVVLLSRPSEGSPSKGDSEQNEEQEKEGEEEQQPPKDESDEGDEEKENKPEEGESAEKEQQDQQQRESEAGEEEKHDDASLQSLLESLEEIDRREQKEIRNMRDRIDFKGGWW